MPGPDRRPVSKLPSSPHKNRNRNLNDASEESSLRLCSKFDFYSYLPVLDSPDGANALFTSDS